MKKIMLSNRWTAFVVLILALWLSGLTLLQAASAGTALSFDGVDDYVSASIGSAMASNYTISAWVYVRTVAADFDPGTAIVSGSCGTTAELLVRTGVGGNVLELGRCNFFIGDASVATVPSLQWVHVAVVVSATKQVSYFINGLAAGTWNASAREVGLGPDITLGFNNGWNRRFDGLLDEVQVWNIARSQSEIDQTMNAQLSGSEPGLIAYWRFNEGSGTSAVDSSGHGATGVTLNGPSWVVSTVPLSAPTITAQPMNQAVFTGSNATFIVSATSTNPPVRYQWRANGINIAGATNATVTITNVQPLNIGDYDVLVSDNVGSVASSVIRLTLLDPPLPTVTTLGATDVRGTRAALNGSVNPNGGLTVAFFQYGLTTNYGSSTAVTNIGSVPGEVLVRLTAANLVKNTTYFCRLVAYNNSGTNFGESASFTTPSSAGAVAVLGAPQVAIWNDDVRTKLLGSGTFDIVDTFLISSGNPVPTLAVLKSYSSVLVFAGGVNYGDGTALGNVLADYFEQGGGVVIAAQGFENMAGRFRSAGYMPFTPGVFASGSFLTLVKVQPDHPLLDGVNSFNGGANSYQNAQIVTSNATLVATWSSGTPLIAAKEVGAARVAGLNFMPVSGTILSAFWQTNTDGARLMANALTWVQLPRPTITQQPTNQYVAAGATASFAVSATTANPPLNYQWRYNGTNIAGATNDTLAVANAQLTNQGPYTVFIQDTSGGVLSVSATLFIAYPYIIWQPTNVTARVGSNVTFTVVAGGALPLFFQWRFNGANVAGATNATLMLTNVQSPQFGDYTVAVSNAFGSATSSVATLNLLQTPVITQTPSPVTTVAGENVTFTVVVTNTATLPITYRWLRQGNAFATNELNSRTGSMTLLNVRTNATGFTNGPGSFRVVCVNAAGTVNSINFALTVLPAVAPSVTTLPATNVTAATATLTGSVNPNSATTWARFDYGTNAGYGSSTPAVNIGNGTNALAFSEAVSGLLPNTTYHFRIAAGNSGGTNFGSDQTFVTSGMVVAPALFFPVKQAGQFSVSFITLSGTTYHLECASSLGASNWVTLGSVLGDGLLHSLADLSATNAQSFYRVRAE